MLSWSTLLLDFLFLTFHSVAVFSRLAAAGLKLEIGQNRGKFTFLPPPPHPITPVNFSAIVQVFIYHKPKRINV